MTNEDLKVALAGVGYVSWADPHHEGGLFISNGQVTLDAEFTLAQLEAIVTWWKEREDSLPARIAPCPFCESYRIERHYARNDHGDDPGCLDCEASRPLEEWQRLVRAARDPL